MIANSQNTCNPGVGLRPTHYNYLEEKPDTVINWFEAISENYMDSSGRPKIMLKKIREDYPVALHGVSMNLASADPLDFNYLKRLKLLVDEIEPFHVSDHLCWTGKDARNLHDLLPFPHTNESLEHIVNKIDQVQNYLQRNILIENVSTYMTFKQTKWKEWDFLTEIAKRTDASLLLDINNIYVSAQNHKFDALEFIDNIPRNIVKQVHLAGYTDMGDFLFDTHSKPVYPEVWKLFSYFIKKNPHVPFMVEWDDDIPEFPIVENEVKKAIDIWKDHHG